jgi:hypothetical protein
MSLLGHEIGNRMPGNKTYVNEYIDATWQHVTALTSSVERYEAPAPWLPKKFASHVESHEQTLKERLEKVRYSIDAVETVNLILDHDRIEYVRVVICYTYITLFIISAVNFHTHSVAHAEAPREDPSLFKARD